MGWDSKGFIPKNQILVNNTKTDEKPGHENKFVHCNECNELISVVSTTLYEIDHKHYCAACYSQKIINMAVERDHYDLQQEKEMQKTEK